MEKYKSDRISLGLSRMYLLRKGKMCMTEKIKNAIQMLVNATYSDEWQGNEELTKAQHSAIRSLQAWEEVLNELEEKKDVEKLVPIGSTAMVKAYKYDESTICMAIEIINQKLAEIEE